MLIVKSSLAVALVFGIGFAAEPAAAETKTLNVVERATTDAVTKTGKADDNAGDLLTFANEVFDEANQNKVGSRHRLVHSHGRRNVLGMLLDVDARRTGRSRSPDLSSIRPTSVLAITGGTGAYAGARGEMALHARNPEGSEYDFRYSIMQ